MQEYILVTGGSGYIGSHTCVELIETGYALLVYDSLSNSSRVALERVGEITNTSIPFVEGDVRSKTDLQALFRQYPIRSVIHFAGLKAVGESVQQPLAYYDNNLIGTITLCEVMAEFSCKNFIFSSSATVYGDPHTTPIQEHFPLSATTPYGRSKLMIEEVLRDLHSSDPEWKIALLRYFNPVGAHPSGLIGEDPKGVPNNLMPYISQVAVGKREKLWVFGDDYNTYDGTGVRDYIHVVDLAIGHVKALQAMDNLDEVLTVNLGTGAGYSVLDMVKAFEKASGNPVPYEVVERRAGDIATCYADPTYAREKIGWGAERGIDEMCEDSWRWQQQNPDGY